MALFPPAPPASFPEMRPGPTSGFFQRQERAFFAQAGKEIVRVRVEIDVPPLSSDESHPGAKSRDQSAPSGAPRTWPQLPPHPPHHSPVESPSPYPHSKRQSRAIPAPAQSPAVFPASPHGQPAQPPLNLHTPGSHHSGISLRTPPHDSHPTGGTKVEFQAPEDYRDDADEAWRRPTPYADRRRAGKHTRRVIVRT
ncbi:hypothetical protein BU15DRAFT_46624 [Melanogaster broomeanus]|nr:hypothetical protein BU15DRAFT_46624 [Melanogaster broomeanus]